MGISSVTLSNPEEIFEGFFRRFRLSLKCDPTFCLGKRGEQMANKRPHF